MRMDSGGVVVLSVTAAIVTLFALIRWTDWERITAVAVASLVIAVPLLLYSGLYLRRKRRRSETLRRAVLGELAGLDAGGRDAPGGAD